MVQGEKQCGTCLGGSFGAVLERPVVAVRIEQERWYAGIRKSCMHVPRQSAVEFPLGYASSAQCARPGTAMTDVNRDEAPRGMRIRRGCKRSYNRD
jgi:hypothetical protein